MLQRIIFISTVFLVFFYFCSAYLLPVIMGGIFAILFYPLLLKMRRFTPIGAFFFTFVITLVFVLPFCFLALFVAKSTFFEIDQLKSVLETKSQMVEGFLKSPNIQKFFTWVTENFPVSTAALQDASLELLKRSGSKIGEFIGDLLSQVPSAIISMTIGLISFYFFLRDGKKLVLFIEKFSFFPPRETKKLMHTLTQICRSVVWASILSAVAQSTLGMLVCAFLGLTKVIVIGGLIFVASFLPVVGSLPVLLTLFIYTLIHVNGTTPIWIFITAVLLFALDSYIKPWFLKGAANLHPLVSFVAALGGVHALGFFGIFIGPIIAALLIQIINIYTLQQYPDKTKS